MNWNDLTSPQLNRVPRETICVLPLGAVEQHGPHLPVATDHLIAQCLAEQLDAACHDQLLLMPSLAVTCSEHHLNFPGTLSLDHETFANVVMQIVQSAAQHGFYRFFLLNAHGGNMAVARTVTERLATCLPNTEVVLGTWFRMAGEQLRNLVEGTYPAVGHACEFETSLLLELRPDLVDSSVIEDDGIAPNSQLLASDMLSEGPTVCSVPFELVSTNGVWGKPSLASGDKGRAILDIVIPTMASLLAAHWPDGPGLVHSESPATTSFDLEHKENTEQQTERTLG